MVLTTMYQLYLSGESLKEAHKLRYEHAPARNTVPCGGIFMRTVRTAKCCFCPLISEFVG